MEYYTTVKNNKGTIAWIWQIPRCVNGGRGGFRKYAAFVQKKDGNENLFSACVCVHILGRVLPLGMEIGKQERRMGGRFVAAKLGVVFAYLWRFEPKVKTVGT